MDVEVGKPCGGGENENEIALRLRTRGHFTPTSVAIFKRRRITSVDKNKKGRKAVSKVLPSLLGEGGRDSQVP